MGDAAAASTSSKPPANAFSPLQLSSTSNSFERNSSLLYSFSPPFVESYDPNESDTIGWSKQPIRNGSSFPGNMLQGEYSLTILEQPCERLRFRFATEIGKRANQGTKNCPKVQIGNCNISPRGPTIHGVVHAAVYFPDGRPHVHKLFGRNCEDGGCTIVVNDHGIASFPNLGILRVKQTDVTQIFFERRVKEWTTEHKCEQKDIPATEHQRLLQEAEADNMAVRDSLGVVKLGFHGELTFADGTKRKTLPVFSNRIYNSQNTEFNELKIADLDRSWGSCRGNDRIWLRSAERMNGQSVKVIFKEERSGWQDVGKFSPSDVYGQVLIIFQTPPYYNQAITDDVTVSLYLERKNGEQSQPRQFTYKPLDDDVPSAKRMRMIPAYTNQPTMAYYVNNSMPGYGYPNANNNFGTNYVGTGPNQSNGYPPGNYFSLPLPDSNAGGPPDNPDTSKLALNVVSTFSADSGISSFRLSQTSRDSQLPDTKTSTISDTTSTVQTQLDALSLNQQSELADPTQFKNALHQIWLAQVAAVHDYSVTGEPAMLLQHCRSLVGVPDEHGNTALHLAVMQNNVDSLDQLLKTVERLNTPADIINVQNDRKQTALNLAVRYGLFDCTTRLLAVKAQRSLPDHMGNTVAHLLADLTDERFYEAILCPDGQACGDALDLSLLNDDGLSALHLALIKHRPRLVTCLLHAHAPVNLADRNAGRYPIHLAVSEGETEALDQLLHAHCDVNVQKLDGTTALHLAVLQNDEAAVVKLISAGANPSIERVHAYVDSDDDDPLDTEDEEPIGERQTAFTLCRGNRRMQTLLKGEELRPLERSDDVASLDLMTRLRLSKMLDARGGWEQLAASLDCEHMIEQIKIAMDEDDCPTMLFLDQYEKMETASLTNLVRGLDEMGNSSAVEMIVRRQSELETESG